MDKNDEHTLMLIKNKLGGSVKSRSGSNSYRYRLHHIQGMTDLVNRINGNIRNTKRVPQLMRICSLLDIPYIPAIPLTIDNAWFSGFFDSDGTITAKFDCSSPSITISVSNKLKIDVEPFLIFNGSTYYSKSGHGHYVWSIQSQSDITNMLEYFKLNPSRSHKLARLNLVNKFYSLRHHQSEGTSWYSLRTKWLLA